VNDKISQASLDEINTVLRKWIKPEKITYVQAGNFDTKKPAKEAQQPH